MNRRTLLSPTSARANHSNLIFPALAQLLNLLLQELCATAGGTGGADARRGVSVLMVVGTVVVAYLTAKTLWDRTVGLLPHASSSLPRIDPHSVSRR